MTITIDFLDKALCYLRAKGPFVNTKSDVPDFTTEENKLLVRAFYKLEKDGFVYTTDKETTSGNRITFFISFDGLLALENSPFPWRNKPYKWTSKKEVIKTIWTVTKVIAVIINAIVILLFTYLTYYKK